MSVQGLSDPSQSLGSEFAVILADFTLDGATGGQLFLLGFAQISSIDLESHFILRDR